MHVYNEFKRGRLSVFERHVIDEDGNSIVSTVAEMPLCELERSGKTVFLLYDDDMRIVPGTYAFLNIHLLGAPVNSRRKAAGQLRRLYCFMALAGRSVGSIDDALLSELCQFLSGAGGFTAELSLKSRRCNNNVNEHLSTYRKYLDFLGVECGALRRSRTVYAQSSYDGGVALTQHTRYGSNLPRKGYCERGVPKYISPDEFRNLLRLAVSKGDETAELVMRLMYVFGLRIGEVLGLAIEDIVEIPIDGAYAPVLILRNRASDRPFQHAKGKDHPLNVSEYASKAYAASQDRVVIDYETHERLVDYVNATHGRVMRERPEDYAKGVADVVSVRDAPDSNHYVFLNRYGRPLSGQTWGNSLKRYFEEAGVARGWDPESDNLSHRFRHGFAMLHAHFRPDPVGALELQKMLRHKWLSSTMVYYNPTEEDEIRIKMAFQKDLRELIPELGAWSDGGL